MEINLRKGRTKTILQSSIDSALLAVEIYNKPRTTFRSEAYIAMMIIAWTRLFHAHFNHTIGQKYFYKEDNGRYKIVDGEKRAWELRTCIKKYRTLTKPVKKNLEFFIKLRNKIEHRHIDKKDVDVLIFGECQSLLFNYENQLIEFFGQKYALNEALVYSLQLSHIRTSGQMKSSKVALSKDLTDIVEYVQKFRTSLSDETYGAQEYSIKLIQVPKISNTNRSDLAIEYVKFDELNEDDKDAYNQIAVLIKDKKVKVEGVNVGRLKPGQIIDIVNDSLGEGFINHPAHKYLYTVFSIRPPGGADDPFDTNTDYCHYDETHGDYVFGENWAEFIIHIYQSKIFTKEKIKTKFDANKKLYPDKYKP